MQSRQARRRQRKKVGASQDHKGAEDGEDGKDGKEDHATVSALPCDDKTVSLAIESSKVAADSARLQHLIVYGATQILTASQTQIDWWKKEVQTALDTPESDAAPDMSQWHGASVEVMRKYVHPLYAWVDASAKLDTAVASVQGESLLGSTNRPFSQNRIEVRTLLNRLLNRFTMEQSDGSIVLHQYPEILLYAVRNSGLAADYLLDTGCLLPSTFEFCDPADQVTTPLAALIASNWDAQYIDRRGARMVGYMSRDTLCSLKSGKATGSLPPQLVGCDLLTLALWHSHPKPLTAKALMVRVPELCARLPFSFPEVPTKTETLDLFDPGAATIRLLLSEVAARRDALRRPDIVYNILIGNRSKPCLLLPAIAKLVCDYMIA